MTFSHLSVSTQMYHVTSFQNVKCPHTLFVHYETNFTASHFSFIMSSCLLNLFLFFLFYLNLYLYFSVLIFIFTFFLFFFFVFLLLLLLHHRHHLLLLLHFCFIFALTISYRILISSLLNIHS